MEIVKSTCGLCYTGCINQDLDATFFQHCTGEALHFVTREKLTCLTTRRHALSLGTFFDASGKWKLTELL